MEIIIAIIIISLVLFGINVLYEDRKYKNNKGVYYTSDVVYIAGFNDTEGGKKTKLDVEFDCLYFKFVDKSKIISTKNIKKCEIKTEHEIKQAISLGKILLFGLFSLGMTTNKTIVNNFLLITYKDINEERHILLQSSKLEELNNKINEILKKQYT